MCLQWSGQKLSEPPRIRLDADSGEELVARSARYAAFRNDYSKLSVPKLKDILRQKNEALGGGKPELVDRIERFDNAELLQRFIQPVSEEKDTLVTDCWVECGTLGTKLFHKRSFLGLDGQVSQVFELHADSVKRLDDCADRSAPDKYLNDELIDYFSKVYCERDCQMCKQTRSIRKPSHILNSFFLHKLFIDDGTYSFAKVQRWTKNIQIFKAKGILIPHCENFHWNLYHIDIDLKEISCYDSSFPGSEPYCKMILR
jgi:hypothetical protein